MSCASSIYWKVQGSQGQGAWAEHDIVLYLGGIGARDWCSLPPLPQLDVVRHPSMAVLWALVVCVYVA